ncbi:MAG TPA: 6-phosphogluconolactonase [Candidatus Acidoferrum sp.]|nr:6-phosphogluconolactonase [Candidatus Acidoferrum sp.]
MDRTIKLFPDIASIAQDAAKIFVNAAQQAVKERGVFRVAMAGGSTPKTLYALLVAEPFRSQLPFDKMQLFFGDDRHVPPDHADSNYRMVSENFISKTPIKPDQVFRMKTELQDTEKAALEYEQILKTQFALKAGELPRFDLMMLGMGNEGHILSLFPATTALRDNGRLVVRTWVGKLYTERITCTAPVANNSAAVLFMITGADKAPALKAVLEGPYEPDQLPAQYIKPSNGKLIFLVDSAAGGMLSKNI